MVEDKALDLKKVNLDLDDVLLVRVPSGKMTDKNVKSIQKRLEQIFPDHTRMDKILVISKDIDFSIVKVEEIDDLLLGKDK